MSNGKHALFTVRSNVDGNDDPAVDNGQGVVPK